MAITNLQQARQLYAMGQRVAKTLDGSRPGYRGPGEYQGGTSSGSGKSSGSGGSSNTGGAGKQDTGNPRDDYIANYVSKSIVKGGGSKKPGTSGTKPSDYNDAFVTGDQGRSARRDFIQTLNTNNAIRANQLGTKFTPYQGGSRPKPRSGLAALLMGGLGLLTGLPGLGLITGGLGSLNKTLRGTNLDGTTRTQAEYEAARNRRQLQKRLDNLYSRKNLGKGYSQKNIDMLEAMGLSPTTPQNQDNARGSNLRNILNESNINNLESLVAATDRGLLEAPGDNLPVVNNSSLTIPADNLEQRLANVNKFDLPLDYSSDDLQARAKRAITQPGIQIDLEPYQEGIPEELQFWDGRSFTAKGYDPYRVEGYNPYDKQSQEGVMSQVPTDDEIAIMRGF